MQEGGSLRDPLAIVLCNFSEQYWAKLEGPDLMKFWRYYGMMKESRSNTFNTGTFSQRKHEGQNGTTNLIEKLSWGKDSQTDGEKNPAPPAAFLVLIPNQLFTNLAVDLIPGTFTQRNCR